MYPEDSMDPVSSYRQETKELKRKLKAKRKRRGKASNGVFVEKKKFTPCRIVGRFFFLEQSFFNNERIEVAQDERAYLRTRDKKLLHRSNYERTYGDIPDTWVVHHVDMNKLNNDPKNLIALPDAFHSRIHVEMRNQKVVFTRDQILRKLFNEHEKYKSAEPLQERLNHLLHNHQEIFKEVALLRSKIDHIQSKTDNVSIGLKHMERMQSEVLSDPVVPGSQLDLVLFAPKTPKRKRAEPRCILRKQGDKSRGVPKKIATSFDAPVAETVAVKIDSI